MKIISISLRIILALVIVLGSFSFNPTPAQAWEQGLSGTHEALNRQAALRFFKTVADNPKYASSPIDRTKSYMAPQVVSSSLAQSGLKVEQGALKFEEWVSNGGFSADEPEIWACVKHFYDPLSINGGPQLTDHTWLHGLLYEAVSAKRWAFEDIINPYSWKQTLEYYKSAMEISEDSKISVIPSEGYRDPDVKVSSAEQARNVYMGKAFRGLGETMHMIGDMTQPAHNRNDSHPNGDLDPIESTANANTVWLVKDAPVTPEADSDITAAANAIDMYEKIALFVNRNFYTDDTIYDKASGVNPRNWEGAYPHPQFSDLKLETGTGPKTYYKEFNGKHVRMAQQTYSSYVLGTTVWQDYIVPPSFMYEQAEVLMPIAIKANAKLIDLFFPTMDLSMQVKENTSGAASANYKEFAITAPFKHNVASDPDWQKAGLSIQYSGPAELWVESGTGNSSSSATTSNNARKLATISYKQGALEKPTAVFVGDKTTKADTYQVKDKNVIYVVINAGGRTFKSNKYTISANMDLSISPAEVTLIPDGRQTFTARATGAGSYQVTWTVDEGPTGGSIDGAIGMYRAPTREGTYHVTATLNSDKSKKATATITVSNVKVAIKPPTAAISPKGTQTFTAEVTGNPEKRVSWKVEETYGGTITADGVYTAPEQGGPYHVIATCRADGSVSAKAVVTIVLPTPKAITLTITPSEVVIVPGGKAQMSASVNGTTDTRVTWSGVQGSPPTQAANIPVTVSNNYVGDYIIRVYSAADPTKYGEAKLRVVPGVWVFVSKTDKSFPNIGYLTAPTGGVTLSAGSGTGSCISTGVTSKWSYTWTAPPSSIPAGSLYKGTISLKDAGTLYDPKTRMFPLGAIQINTQMNGSIFDSVSTGAGREMHVTGFPLTASRSEDFSLKVPTGSVGGPVLTIYVGAEAEVNDGEGSGGWVQQWGESLYKYELRTK